MSPLKTQIMTDTWIHAPWDEYIENTEKAAYQKAKFYYHQNQLRIEMSPIGNDHSSDHSLINYVVTLYAAVNHIALNGKDNCSYQKPGQLEAQPDLSYYIGDTVNAIPYGTTIINLDQYPPPTLVIEVANTSLADDQGQKRLLYEELNVKEYWIVDVQHLKIIAFKIENQGSYRIATSQVLPQLEISFVEEILRQSRQINHSEIAAWLLSRWYPSTQN